jgi:hypothetical protein
LLVAATAAVTFRAQQHSPLIGASTVNFAMETSNSAGEKSASAVGVSAADMNATDMNATDISSGDTAESSSSYRPSSAAWEYSTSFDEARSATVYAASLDSENLAYFDSPYEGGSSLRMQIIRTASGTDGLLFKISKGQFICHDECSAIINFGDGPETVHVSEPSDGSSDMLLTISAQDVIDHLKKAKRFVVELPFYQEGGRQFTFEIQRPLVWPPKGSGEPTVEDE